MTGEIIPVKLLKTSGPTVFRLYLFDVVPIQITPFVNHILMVPISLPWIVKEVDDIQVKIEF